MRGAGGRLEVGEVDRFEFVPHTADVAVVVRGESLEEVFENGASALFTVLADPSRVRDAEPLHVEIQSPDLESLFVDWLNELLFLFESQGKLFCRFEVRELAENRLRAEVWGEAVDRSRHRIKTGVKAVTYHDLEIRRVDSGWRAKVVFDV